MLALQKTTTCTVHTSSLKSDQYRQKHRHEQTLLECVHRPKNVEPLFLPLIKCPATGLQKCPIRTPTNGCCFPPETWTGAIDKTTEERYDRDHSRFRPKMVSEHDGAPKPNIVGGLLVGHLVSKHDSQSSSSAVGLPNGNRQSVAVLVFSRDQVLGEVLSSQIQGQHLIKRKTGCATPQSLSQHTRFTFGGGTARFHHPTPVFLPHSQGALSDESSLANLYLARALQASRSRRCAILISFCIMTPYSKRAADVLELSLAKKSIVSKNISRTHR